MDKSNDPAACNGDQHETDPVDNMDEDAAAKEKLTSADPNKVKFTSVNLDGYDGKNGEARVDIQVTQATVGMGKDELMKYANEPFWVRLRLILFIFFWIVWFVMLFGAVIIIILAPRCPPPPQAAWYSQNALYQVDVETFKDSDGNGIGDFKGIIEKIDYFKKQNIKALMLSAFYKSESGGIVDHKEIDSKVGTLADFEELVAKLKENDIRLVLDFIPNHSSDKHPWFIASVENQEPYSDFYIWADSESGFADKNKPPNNWPSVEGGSAWEWNDNRQQFYLHTFGKDKPDLNLRNELVRQELKEIIKFWMSKGIDGFNVVAASHLVEDSNLSKDEAIATENKRDAAQYKDFNHMYTLNQPENVGLFEEWKDVIKNFTVSNLAPKVLMAEVSGPVSATMKYFGNGSNVLANLVYDKQFTETIGNAPTGIELKDMFDQMENISSPALLVGNKDMHRLATRVGEELIDAVHMIAVVSRGATITYNGDELGIPDYVPKDGEFLTSQTVMLWNNETSGGFSSGAPNYPVHTSYETINVAAQENIKESHLKVFRNLLALTDQLALSFGLQAYPLVTNETFSIMRVRKGSPGYLVVVNLSNNATVVDFTGTNSHLPVTARVEIRSTSIMSGVLAAGNHPKVPLNKIPLEPKQAVLFSFVPIFG